MVFEQNRAYVILVYIPCCISESTEDCIGKAGIIEKIEVILLQFLNLQYAILRLKNFMAENVERFAFSLLLVHFLSLRIYEARFGEQERVIEELFKAKSPCFDKKILRLTEVQTFLYKKLNCDKGYLFDCYRSLLIERNRYIPGKIQ